MADAHEYPTVDGAPLNPYDLPGEPRPPKDEPTPAPTAEESAPVPGPGDPEHTTLVEIGGGEGSVLASPSEVTGTDPLAFLTADQRAALAAKGYGSPEAIRAASDEELDAVDGIGPATVTRLREATEA